MKNLFGFDQNKLVESKLSLAQAVLLGYFKIKAGQELTYSDIIQDMPILGVGTRQIRRLIDELVEHKEINKTSTTKNAFIIQLSQKWITACPKMDTTDDNLSKNGQVYYKYNNKNKLSNKNKLYKNSLSNNKYIDINTKQEQDERDRCMLEIWKYRFPDKYIPEDTVFEISDEDFNNLNQKIDESSFLSSRPYLDFEWCLKNKKKILNGGYADKKDKQSADDDWLFDFAESITTEKTEQEETTNNSTQIT